MTSKRRPDPRLRSNPSTLHLAAGVLVAWASFAAEAQTGGAIAGDRPGVGIVPRLTVAETLTDNLSLSPDKRDAALITSISPGLSISSNSGRLRGTLDYALNGLIYTKSRQAGQVQNALSARATLDAWDSHLLVDGQASISQQSVSAFGPINNDNSLANVNSTEVATLSLSPYLRGQLARLLSYEMRGSMTESRAKDSVTGDFSSRSGLLQLAGLGGGLLNWSAVVNTQRTRAKAGRDTENSTASGTLIVRPDIDWSAGLTAGRERNDYSSLTQQSSTTYGLNGNWTPTPRTKISADWMRHGYGNSHSLSFEHRMARTVWRYVDTQSLNAGGAQNGVGAQTNYELFFLMFASIEPDPVQRDLLVKSFLKSQGMNPGALVNSGFLNASNALSRSRQFSFALQGVRTTLTLLVSRSESRRLAANLAVGDDLAQSSTVMQRGFSVSLSHQLTPSDSALLALSQQQSRGDLLSQSTDLKSITANWSTRLGARTTVQLGLRHNRFSSALQPYDESAVTATLTRQF